MVAYLTRRLVQAIFVLLGASLVAFLLTHFTGDPILLIAGPDWTKEDIEQLRAQLGYDQPWHIQYFSFLTRAVRGDLGISIRYRLPAAHLIRDTFPATLQLTVAAMAITLVLALPAGVIAAVRPNGVFDIATTVFILLGQSMPVFLLGILLIVVFGVELRILPISGAGSISHLVLPATTLALNSAARIARLVRSSMLEVLSQDYVRTARAKGLSEDRVVNRHALRNAMIPIVTLASLQLGLMLGGAVVTETVFAWPGLGQLIVTAVYTRDLPLVQASVLFLAVIFVVLNLLVDLSYAYLDPRIRYE